MLRALAGPARVQRTKLQLGCFPRDDLAALEWWRLGQQRTAAAASGAAAAAGLGTSREQIASLDAAALGRAARRSIAEGDLAEEPWRSYAARASELACGLSLGEAARLSAAFSTARSLGLRLASRLSSSALERLRSPDREPRVAAADLRRLALASGRARAFDSELMEALVPMILDRVGDFRPRDLARIADAYARMPVQSADLFALIADALPPYLYDLEPAELVSLCRSFAEAAVYNAELIDALCTQVSMRVRTFGALECLVFLDGLSRLNAGLPEELRRDDLQTFTRVVGHLARLLGTLAAVDLVRTFSILVRFGHYDPWLVHTRLCPALAQKLGQLQGPRAFTDLAELLHCLGLLPAQSHKSAELALGVAAAMRRAAQARSRFELRAVALAVAALAQLGQDDEELLMLLSAALLGGCKMADWGVVGTNAAFGDRSATPEVLSMASNVELLDLRHALGLCRSNVLLSALAAVEREVQRRGTET
mmetsp:Transcript_56535/g.175725  ORF Transcript_56535/g.175725 Transcript_56535/m.175725 type:complete len:483 (+) Transcript_56535:114-1562(+)